MSSGKALLRLKTLEPGLYLVAGEAGAGKSALLDFFARGLAYYQQKHRHCPAPWRAKGGPGELLKELLPRRKHWVILAEGAEPELWAELARDHPVFLGVASDELEVAEPLGVAGKIVLPALKPHEARVYLFQLGKRLKRIYQKQDPRRRPSWARAYLAPDAEIEAWAEQAARAFGEEPLKGLSVPLVLGLWAEAFPPGEEPPKSLLALAAEVVSSLAEHAGKEVPEEAAKRLALLRPRPWVSERVLARLGLLEDVLTLVEIGIARRYCPDCFGFAHPLFAGYYLAKAGERPRLEDDLYAWLFYLESLPEAERLQALMELPCQKALPLARKLGVVLGKLYQRLCRDVLSQKEGKLALALDPSTPYEVLEELAKDPLLRWAVAANPGAPPELLEWIRERTAKDDYFVRQGLELLIARQLANRH